MQIYEEAFEIPATSGHSGLLAYLGGAVGARIGVGLLPIRFVIAETTQNAYRCELGVVAGLDAASLAASPSMFEFRPRGREDMSAFTAVMLVPTGIGCAIGGHAGDAAPAAKLLASVCDTLIIHPNVVNASDINEIPDNALYVEGSVISRFLMGTLGLQRVRANRVLVVIDEHPDRFFTSAAINSVNGARASYGLACPRVIRLDPPVRVTAHYAASGRAAGRVERLHGLLDVLERYRGEYDALAISTQVQVPDEVRAAYYQSHGEVVNPWGGAEAIFTHALSSLYDIPTAHSPMFESREIARRDLGVVDPRMAAEAISTAFFNCVLKGLQRSPRIVTAPDFRHRPEVLTAADVSCLVIPEGCVGVPTLAALEQGIPVIAVGENSNLMRNDLSALPWAPGQLHRVENYWEAAGVMAAIKVGMAPCAVRRPLANTLVEKRG